jgi:biotin-(acetyl-CoA carboxylase) ligase
MTLDDEPKQDPDLPPLYAATALRADQDPLDEAIDQARAGAPAGAFLWSRRSDCIDFAVVLEPDHPREQSLPVALVAMVAMLEALGGVMPPSIAVTFGWPDRIDVNGAFVGGLRVAVAPCAAASDVPDWMVAAVTIAVSGDLSDDSPGLNPERTTLFDEGCGAVDIVDFSERFGRHFLHWINRWQEDGLEPVRQAWLARESGFGEETGIHFNNQRIAGRFVALDDRGGAVLDIDGAERVFSLDAALHPGSWSRGDLLLARHAVP